MLLLLLLLLLLLIIPHLSICLLILSREEGTEKHQLVAVHTLPDWGSNLQPSGVYKMTLQPTELPGWGLARCHHSVC